MKRRLLDYGDHPLHVAIQNHLLPFFEIPLGERDDAVGFLLPGGRLLHTVKYQLLEEPGPAEQGQFMLVLRGLVDSYYRCPFTLKLWGRHIYYRHDAVFTPESFYRGEARTDYIRALEPSTLLALPYNAVRAWAERHPEVHAKLHALAASRTQYLLEYNLRNTLPAKACVRAFLEQHPTLSYRTTAEICAMHNHMSRYWYVKTVKDLEK